MSAGNAMDTLPTPPPPADSLLKPEQTTGAHGTARV